LPFSKAQIVIATAVPGFIGFPVIPESLENAVQVES
jgi:hypothetical protein